MALPAAERSNGGGRGFAVTTARWRQVKEILYAASQIDGSGRERYLAEQCGDDVSLRAEIEDLLVAVEESGRFLETPPRAFLDFEEMQIGPYRILDEAGRGGMGVVYRALRDGDYQQIVAIKLVRAELANQSLTERFRIERQTLALLNHPNIARLLDGGATADGRPYLVMEWIEGRPIHQYCREQGLTTRQRLELFLLVCDAVAHAHRNLVVHRDLKPSNILITTEGQPKLLDFGIAKVFSMEETEPEATLTLAGARPLTPEYASPEQVRQEAVTTATDVYSLGAVLYELLTGAQAHRIETRTPGAIERAVCGSTPLAASSVTGPDGVPRRELRGDLDNILAKALEKDPARRYPHVDEFAADIRRHLECRPVLARPASLAYRVSRFARRNKLLVGSAAAVLVALAGGLGMALWQAHRARVEQDLAEQRFQLARQLAGSVLYEFHDGIRDLQGSLKVQQLVLQRSLEYLDKLAAGARTNPALERDLANGYERVAELAGGGGISNLGRDQEALHTLRKALELRRQVLASNPRSPEFRRDLARTHRRFVDLDTLGASERLEHAKAATSLVEGLLREAPADSRIRNDLAISEYDMGLCLEMQARFLEAAVYFRKALAHAADPHPENLALYHKRLGGALIRSNDLPGAIAEYRAALAIDEPRALVNLADVRAKLNLSYDYSDIGLILRLMGRTEDGLEQYRKAQRIRAEVAAADPKDARPAHGLAVITWRIADLLAAMGDRRKSEAAFVRAVELAESYRSRFPEKGDAAGLLADISREFGEIYSQRWGSCEKAQPRLERSRQLYRDTNNAQGVQSTESLMKACSARDTGLER